MKNLFVFAVVCGSIYGALVYFGVLGGDDASSTANEPETTSAPLETPPEPKVAGSTTPLAQEFERAAELVSQGHPLGDLKKLVEETAADGTRAESTLAYRLLAIGGENARDRWLAASACVGDERLSQSRRDAFAAYAVQLARPGLIASSPLRHRVVKGDSLEKICKLAAKNHALQLTPGTLMWVNGLSSDRIKINQELILPAGAFRIAVSKSRYTLQAWMGEGLVRVYSVSIGRDGKTPQAVFKVEDKLEKPPWDDPSTGKRLHYGEPGYALGTRWIAFNSVDGHTGLGIHGTDDPGSIGTAASLGCIRLENGNVEDLYALVPIGAVVEIGA